MKRNYIVNGKVSYPQNDGVFNDVQLSQSANWRNADDTDKFSRRD